MWVKLMPRYRKCNLFFPYDHIKSYYVHMDKTVNIM